MTFAPRLLLAASLAALSFGAFAHDHSGHEGHDAQAKEPARKPSAAKVTLTDTALVDQEGRARKVKSEVVGDRIVIVDFVYTTCTTICPVISATFADVQKRLGESLGRDVALVSISVDPARDTPAALKAFGDKVGSREGWTWLTGRPQDVNGVLKGFGAYVGAPEQHPAMVLVGDGRTGEWTRYFGFPSAAQLLAKVDELRAARGGAKLQPVGYSLQPVADKPAPARENKGREYFTDTVLEAQDGRKLRFYSDVLRGRNVVLINFMYTSCGDACPLITSTLVKARNELGDAFGRDVRFVSLSVDPEHDTPADMAKFAKKQNAVHPEWLFLTGKKANVDIVLKKLGSYTDDPTDHQTGMIIGNTRTDHWRKVRPDAPPAAIAAELRSLLAEPVAAAQ
jgi:cytochrome oxidase Cu insertion factor (SCO1/SenC/PrrC family)